MQPLPQHIENYLLETGFSSTEVLALKHLISGEVLTLRELAAKTGKSTGVLDQATKKLLRKSILERPICNGTAKYALGSLDSLTRWMQEDMKGRWDSLRRRKQDFETYISSVQRGKQQPAIEYYERTEGLQKAQFLLLDACDELLGYFPFSSAHAEDGDPLKEFRHSFLEERRRRGIFCRVVAHDMPSGRRYQSRDPFEFRKTVLVPEKEYAFSFEKIIAGDTIGCFDWAEQRATLIRYPALARAERSTFEVIWGMMSQRELEKRPCSAPCVANGSMPFATRRRLWTRILSTLPSWLRDTLKLCRVIPRVQLSGSGTVRLDIEVLSKDRVGIVHDIAHPFAQRLINITKFIVFALPPDETLFEIQFEARALEEISYITDALQRIPGIMSVRPKATPRSAAPPAMRRAIRGPSIPRLRA